VYVCTKLAKKNYSIAPADYDFNEVKNLAVKMASKMLNLKIGKFFPSAIVFGLPWPEILGRSANNYCTCIFFMVRLRVKLLGSCISER
jgi:hypothetical protein